MRLIILSILALFPFLSFAQNGNNSSTYYFKGTLAVGKGTTSPANASALLEIGNGSDNRGVLMPRVLDIEAIPNPVEGLFAYETGTKTLRFFDGLEWKTVGDDAFIPLTQKGAANGVATLDGTSKIPLDQIPAALIGAVNYQGTYAVATNTPTLPTATGNEGFYYIVTDSAVYPGNGLTYRPGDWIISNGTVWQKVDNNSITMFNNVVGLTDTLLNYWKLGGNSPSTAVSIGTRTNQVMNVIVNNTLQSTFGPGYFANNAFINTSSGNNARMDLNPSGASVSSNKANADDNFTSNITNASSTGALYKGIFNGTTNYTVTRFGDVLSNGIARFAGQTNMFGSNTLAGTHTITMPSVATGFTYYNTVDQTTNYERLRLFNSSNVFNLYTEQGGTGILRNIKIGSANRGWTVSNTGANLLTGATTVTKVTVDTSGNAIFNGSITSGNPSTGTSGTYFIGDVNSGGFMNLSSSANTFFLKNSSNNNILQSSANGIVMFNSTTSSVSLIASAATGVRALRLPDSTGTVALLQNIPNFTPTNDTSFIAGGIIGLDVTPTDIISISISAESAYSFQVRTFLRSGTSPIESASFNDEILVKNEGGTLTIVGDSEIFTPIKSSGMSATTLSFDVSGTNLVIRATAGSAITTNFRVSVIGLKL